MPARDRTIRVPEQLRIIMGMQIDEAWRYQHPAGVDHLFRLMRLEIAYFCDLAVLDTYIRPITRHSGAVDYHSAPDNYIEFRHFVSSCRHAHAEVELPTRLLQIPGSLQNAYPRQANLIIQPRL